MNGQYNMVCAILKSSQDYFPDEKEYVRTSLFKHYEKVIVQSIVTSFGLDSLIKDHDGEYKCLEIFLKFFQIFYQ